MYNYLAYPIDPAFQVSGLYVQGKVVKLLASISDLIYLVARFSLENVLAEFDLVVSEEYDSKLPVAVQYIPVWNYFDTINVDTEIPAF